LRCTAGAEAGVTELLRLRRGVYQKRVAVENPITADTVGLVKLLADNRIPVARVTGAQRGDVLAVLAASPIGELFSVLIAEEDVTDGKPHPEGFLTAAQRLHRSPTDVLVFEDSVPGVKAAVAAGMHCIAVAGAEPGQELQAVAPAIVGSLTADLLSGALSRRGA
jgi:beta-phosphoglucomutase